MINNPAYKNYSGQIANIFCNGNTICGAGVKQRIIANFNDDSFESWLQNLSRGKVYLGQIKNYRMTNQARYYDFVTEDVLSADVKTIPMTAGANWSSQQFLEGIPNNLNYKGYQIIGGKNYFSSDDLGEKRLYYAPNAGSYGITFNPSSVPGGGGTIAVQPTPPVTTPGGEPGSEPKQAGGLPNIDIVSLLSNPIVMIGIGVAIYYGWKNMR